MSLRFFCSGTLTSLMLRTLYTDMQKFYFSKDVVGFATSVTMGFATKDVILKVVHDILVPLLKGLAKISRVHSMTTHLHHIAARFGILPVLRVAATLSYDIFIWFVLLVSSFVLLEYFVGKTILGFNPAVHDAETEKKFDKAKREAGNCAPAVQEQQEPTWEVRDDPSG